MPLPPMTSRQQSSSAGPPRHPSAVAVAMLVIVVSACGSKSAGDDPPADVAAFADPGSTVYDCYGVTTTAADLEEAPSVAELTDHPGAEAFMAAVAAGTGTGTATIDDLAEWRAPMVSDEYLGAIRPLDPPDVMDGEVRDHERLFVSLVDGAWHTSSAGPCTLRAELDGLGPAIVLLDPEALPEPDDISLSLLVIEMACASGQPATARVTVTVEESADEVRLFAGVRPVGEATCPSNPTTPITVELDEPLGDRRLVDAARLPQIEVQPHEPLLAPQTGG